MRLIETIKIVDGKCQNLEYHSHRAGFLIEQPPIADSFMHGVVKWRIVYHNDSIVEQSMSHYSLPKITSLRVVESDEIEYARKYEDRSGIASLLQQRKECDDIIIVRRGLVSDSSFCNLVFENSEGLFTPSTPLLKGTKRQMLLNKGVIAEREIAASDIKKYDNVRLINAMIELNDNLLKIDELTILS